MNSRKRLTITLTDDQALEIIAQIGQMLSPNKLNHEQGEDKIPTIRKYRQRGPLRRVYTFKGKPTVSGQIFDFVNKSEKGTIVTFNEFNTKFNTGGKSVSSIWSALKKLKEWKQVRKVSRGTYEII